MPGRMRMRSRVLDRTTLMGIRERSRMWMRMRQRFRMWMRMRQRFRMRMRVRFRMRFWMWMRERFRVWMRFRMWMRKRLRMRMWMRERTHMPRVAAMMPPVPADGAAPTDAAMEVFAAPVPAATVPSGVVPAVLVPLVPIQFLRGFARRRRELAPHPALRRQLGTLRQHQRGVRLYRRGVHGDAQVVGIGDGENVGPILECPEFPRLLIAADTIAHGDRIAGARRLVRPRAKARNAKSAGGQG